MKSISVNPAPVASPTHAAGHSDEPTHAGAVKHGLALGRPVARRQSVHGSGVESQRLHRQIDELATEVAQLAAKDDTEVSAGTLTQALHGDLALQQRWEKKATSDHFGAGGWANMRRKQLQQIPGGEVAAAQYGLSFAYDLHPPTLQSPGSAAAPKPQRPSSVPNRPHIDIANTVDAPYRRNLPNAENGDFAHALYQLRYPQEAGVPRVFVDSPHQAQKLITHLRTHVGLQGAVAARPLADGVFALACANPADTDTLMKQMHLMGGQPSPYQLQNAWLHANNAVRPVAMNPNVDTLTKLAELRGAEGNGAAARLREVVPELGTATLAHTAADLIDELGKVLSIPMIAERHRHDPRVANALHTLRYVAESMPSHAADSARFGNAYRAMLEEMQVILSTVRPYSLSSFKSMACSRVRAALDPAHQRKMVKTEACLTTCGMQAVTQSFDIARNLGKGRLDPLTHGDKISPLYYEAQQYLDQLKPRPDAHLQAPNAFHATLGDSLVHAAGQPHAGWSVDDIIGGIQQRLQNREPGQEPLTVVIDSTIERADDLPKLLGSLGPALADDRLRILLCRSQQKFASLGAPKVMGSSITLLGADTLTNRNVQTFLRTEETQRGWFANDEAQLLTHLTRVAQQREPELLQNAIDNAQFIVDQCFNGHDGHAPIAGHEPNMPFAQMPTFSSAPKDQWPSFTLRKAGGDVKVAIPPAEVLDPELLRQRMSFGFTDTNIGSLNGIKGYSDNLLRISLGQETKAELIERFWMPSRQMQLGLPSLDTRAAQREVMQLVNAALPGGARQTQPLSQKLQTIAQAEATPLTDAQRQQGGVTAMRTARAAPQAFTLNKIASVLSHLAHVTEKFALVDDLAHSEDRQPLDEMLTGLIDAGLPNVSRLGRERIVGLQCALLRVDLNHADSSVRRAAVDKLLHTFERGGISSGLGLFNATIPDAAYTDLPSAAKEKLVERLFGTLEPQAKLHFLIQHKTGTDGRAFLQDCATHLESQLCQTAPSETQRQWQANLLQEMVNRSITQQALSGKSADA